MIVLLDVIVILDNQQASRVSIFRCEEYLTKYVKTLQPALLCFDL